MPGRLAYIMFLDRAGRPVDPGYGVDEGAPGIDNSLPGGGEYYPDNGLPIPNPPPGKPGHLPSVPPGRPIVPSHPIVKWPTRPVDPDWGVTPTPNPPDGQPGHLPSVPPGFPIIPSHPWIPPRPVRPGHLPSWGGRPVDPGYGVGGEYPDNGLPGNPNFPDNSLPTTPPPTVPVGSYLVLVRTPTGQWKYAVVQGTPPATLPEPPPTAQPKS